MEYMDFLRGKVVTAPVSGFAVRPEQVNPALKPHQRDAVIWACRGGRRALFESFGLGKTVQELEYCHLVIEQGETDKALIVLPLGVRQEFYHDAAEVLAMPRPRYITADAGASEPGIYLTNYERVRDGDIDPKAFGAAVLDEAAVLRSFGSKTYQTFLPLFRGIKYKLVATATPSPNRLKELIHYAGFLEIMDTGQALTRFFQRDSTKANNLTLYPHKEEEFWLWVSTWALYIGKPSDLGYDDAGYDLPPLEVRRHVVSEAYTQVEERDGQLKLQNDVAEGLAEASREKNSSIAARVAKAREIVEASPDEHFVLWHDLEAEREEIERTFPIKDWTFWHQYKDGNKKALEMYERHYSCYHYADGRERKLFCGPGEKLVLMTAEQDALCVWRKFIDASGQSGVNCAVFRNEGNILSSDLLREAATIAWSRWPGQRLYTYVNPAAIKSTNPGYCFKMAGWRDCGQTAGGLRVLELYPCAEDAEMGKTGLSTIYGSMDYDERERRVIDFSEGRTRLFATKKSLSGSGCNFQRHCHRAIFVGIDYQFHDFIQAIHRIYRFLQQDTCIVDIIYTEAEQPIYDALMEKWKLHNEMQERMGDIVRRYGLHHRDAIESMARSIGVKRVEIKGKHFTAVNNDCVEETARMADDSVDLIVTSVPFSNHYEYTPSYNDFGHNEDNRKFFEQMDFLTPNLLRALKPGRLACIHVKDRILFGNATGTGMPTVDPFSDMCVLHYIRHGFQYMGRIVILTDVVRENNQTYRLGWSEQCKDGTKMGVGCPEYVLLFRKLPTDTSKAYADEPVTKSKEEYTRAQWQLDAHAFWKSSGDRLMTKEELEHVPVDRLQAAYRQYSRGTVYDYGEHVALARKLDADGHLPATFMVVAPGSWSPWVWDDINRMRTLNTTQSQRRQTMHVCPLQLDIVDRLINRYSNPGDLVLDPFGGLGTVALEAVKTGRRGYTIELNDGYFRDAVGYLEAAEDELDMPTLFDMLGVE